MKEQLHERHEFRDFRHLIDWASEEYGDRPAFSYAKDGGTERVSYRTLREDVYALSAALAARGIAGHHAVLVGKLSYEWALLYYSVIVAGGVLVPLDREWTAEDLRDTA
ncbi:MAG: AMP-binding protein, partial [Clostridia bacterium]|nr:AMP-binding protein [Clostridia bacterium]